MRKLSATNTAGIGTGGMSSADNFVLSESQTVVGHLAPLLGRVAKVDVVGYFGFPIIRAGQSVTDAILDKAQSQGKLYEVIASTEEH